MCVCILFSLWLFFGDQAVKLQVNPLYILVPVTICSSFAFAFPVATPPNAIVFAFGHLRILDMVRGKDILQSQKSWYSKKITQADMTLFFVLRYCPYYYSLILFVCAIAGKSGYANEPAVSTGSHVGNQHLGLRLL